MKLHRSCSSMEKASTKARNLDKTVETGTLAMAENQEENWIYGGIYNGIYDKLDEFPIF